MGYRSQDVSLTISADTEIRVEMDVDPIRLDSLLVEAGFIDIRGTVVDAATGARIPEARVRVGRAPETFGTSRGSFRVKNLLRGDFTSHCIFVDETKYPFVEILETFQAGEVERIEIFGRGAMIRVYTQEFVARQFGREDQLPGILYAPAYGKPVCH